MNMKKTIAAIAACAMAVSAMATTVSAEEATAVKSVHYDLTFKTEATSANVTFVGKNIDSTVGALQLFVPFNGMKTFVEPWVGGGKHVVMSNIIKVKVNNKTQELVDEFKFTWDTNSDQYDGTTTRTMVMRDATGNWVTTNDVNAATADCIEIDLTNPRLAPAIKEAFNGRKDLTFTIDFVGLADGTTQAQYNTMLTTAGVFYLIDDVNTVYNAKGTVSTSDIKAPFRTHANTTTGVTEIIGYLGRVGIKDKGAGYQNVGAVINDMIANYEDVEFKFNTATDNVLTAAWLDGKEGWIGNAQFYAGYYVTGIPQVESWMGDGTFKSFPQHLYNLYGDEGTGYTYSDGYVFNNLFNSALIANNGFTMNQSSVEAFAYNATSVTFKWVDLTGGAQFVYPAGAINTLQLATSAEWYWDSMDVTGMEVSAEDTTTSAGSEDDSEDLPEDDEDEDAEIGEDDAAEDDADVDVADDDVADDDAAEDDTDDAAEDDADDADDDADAADDDADDTTDAADDTTGDAAEAGNPGTGNAPIALAVIPVALAAAAVVAKKRS
ncbi:MAG: hypothetical protein ACI4YB_10475 [Oscillospiraceae bacterium]